MGGEKAEMTMRDKARKKAEGKAARARPPAPRAVPEAEPPAADLPSPPHAAQAEAAAEGGPQGAAVSERSAGGVVTRPCPGGFEVALAEQIDPVRGERLVRLPKGHIDPGESDEQAALREVAEEIGVRARIREALGEIAYRYFEPRRGEQVAKRVRFFWMEWLEGEARPLDGEMDAVRWEPAESAAQRLHYEGEREMVRRAVKLLSSGSAASG